MKQERTWPPSGIPKMMIAFVIRRCTVALGHPPTPEEFAAWANNQLTGRRRYRLFGRPISEFEARIILKHQSRLVSAKSASAEEQYIDEEQVSAHPNVVSLDDARRRAQLLRKRREASRVKR